jgi:hypothetical protein
MKHVFIVKPEREHKQALDALGLRWVSHTVDGQDGILLDEKISRKHLASALLPTAGLQPVPTEQQSQVEGLVTVRLVAKTSGRSKNGTTEAELPGEPAKARTSRKLINFCDSLFANVTSAQDSLDEIRRGYTNLVRDYSKSFYANCESSVQASRIKFLNDEFDAILRHSKVVRVSFDSRSGVFRGRSALCVVTKELCCTHPESGDVHEIGAFKIRVEIADAPDENSVHFENLTRSVAVGCDSFAAPHILIDDENNPKSTKPCLGNLDGRFADLLETGEYLAVVDLAIKFVESVNIDDRWGENLPLWPLKRQSK